jgi:hypothetical protein
MKGAPETVSAAEAAIIATMSGSLTRSWLSTVHITSTSFLKPGTNSGRIGRSIRRAVSVSFSVGPRLALEEAAGDLARGIVFFLVVDGQREEILPFGFAPWQRSRWP